MRRLATFCMLFSLCLFALGCSDTESEKAGNGDTSSENGTETGAEGQATFTIETSNSELSVQPGGDAQLTVTVNRDQGESTFEMPVEISFAGLPSGVKANPEKSMVEKGNTEAQFTITTEDGTQPGDHEFTVQGAAEGIDPVDVKVEVTVEKPEENEGQ